MSWKAKLKRFITHVEVKLFGYPCSICSRRFPLDLVHPVDGTGDYICCIYCQETRDERYGRIPDDYHERATAEYWEAQHNEKED